MMNEIYNWGRNEGPHKRITTHTLSHAGGSMVHVGMLQKEREGAAEGMMSTTSVQAEDVRLQLRQQSGTS